MEDRAPCQVTASAGSELAALAHSHAPDQTLPTQLKGGLFPQPRQGPSQGV